MKYLIFPPLEEPGPTADDLIASYNVNPDDCLIRDPRIAVEQYPPELLVLSASVTGNYNVAWCVTVKALAERLKARRSPAGAEPPVPPLGARSAPRPRSFPGDTGDSSGAPA